MSEGIFAFRDGDDNDFEIFDRHDDALNRANERLTEIIREHGKDFDEKEIQIWKLMGTAWSKVDLKEKTIYPVQSLQFLEDHCEKMNQRKIKSLKTKLLSAFKHIEVLSEFFVKDHLDAVRALEFIEKNK